MYAHTIQQFLEKTLHRDDLPSKASPNIPSPLDPLCYEDSDLYSPGIVQQGAGWKMITDWRTDQTCNWTPPTDLFIGEEPGAGFRVHFTGTAIGLSMLAGMDNGDIDYSIDGGAYQTVQLFDQYCTKFYRPKIVMLSDDLISGKHIIDIRISKDKHEESIGHAVRILKLLLKGMDTNKEGNFDEKLDDPNRPAE
ncbi:hypothetical protein D3C73_832430 [compost metagenome]